MAIAPEDVKLYESQRLTDEDDGGGRATGNEVVDGNVNNLFPDISRLDRTVGDVALRKAFIGVDTSNADVLLGSHAILVKPPADPLVEVLIFDAGTESDDRTVAQNRIESYVVQGAAAQFELLGNQYENQRQVVAVQREEVAIPSTGDVFLLEDQGNSQYVRLTEVETEIATFAYQNGSTYTDFTRRRMVLSISSPLAFTFRGGEAVPSGTTGAASAKTEVSQTEVADAARYWGVKNTTDAAAVGDLQIKVDNIYSSLVPSAQSEQPLIDQNLGYDKLAVVAGADANYTESLTGLYSSTTDVQVFLARACVPGTCQLTLGGSNYADAGTGTLARSSGAFPFAELTIDYNTGAIFGPRDSGNGTQGSTMSGTATYRPGAAFTGRTATAVQDVTLNTRGYNWTISFAEEKPRPGTLVASYMAQGEWYELRDNGAGQLIGTGSGSIDYQTGSVLITLEALPDVDTSILYSFIMDVEEEYESHNQTIAAALPEIEIALEPGVQAGSLVMSYTAGGVVKNITDDSSGNLQGDATGVIEYADGIVKLVPIALPDDGTGFNASYNAGSRLTGSGYSTGAVASGTVTGTLSGAPIQPGTVRLRGHVYLDSQNYFVERYSSDRPIYDDGQGGWVGVQYSGSINYATGAFSVTYRNTAAGSRERLVNTYIAAGGGKDGGGIPPEFAGTRTLVTDTFQKTYYLKTITSSSYRQAADTAAPEILSGWNPETVTLNLLDGESDDEIVESSMLFDFASETYYDRDGIIYKNKSSQTGAGTAVGVVNYTEKTVTLDTWNGGSSAGLDIHSLLTTADTVSVSSVAFRLPGAPVRPQSITVTVTDTAGNILQATADADGFFDNNNIAGNINYNNGVVQLRFTSDFDDDTGASDIAVMPNGQYNAVLYSYLPLDAELIGLDPVRLPGDGRVPIYREGDVIVIHNTQTATAGTPTDGQIIDTGRDNLATALVYDSTGTPMDPAQYTVDKPNGTVTFANPVLIQDAATNPLTPPLEIRDRIEHMTVANDVQITGEISFIAPLAHDFPATSTYVSSSLLWGDLNSRVYSRFTQRVWNNGNPNWTDQLIGDETTAQYNDIDNPIEYANNGAITEKWALWFYSSSAFYIVGEQLGIIGQGNINSDTAPINGNTGNPYFVVRGAGWGVGWATNNVMRFNTDGCLGPIWLVRTVLSGQATEANDEFTLQLRGDAD